MNPRFPGAMWLAPLVLVATACGVDSSAAGEDGAGGDTLNSPKLEATAEARAALVSGAGSVGNCNGNPARCAGVTLSSGSEHTMALMTNGTVWAWGINTYGSLGDGTTFQPNTPVAVTGMTGLNNVTAIAGGSLHSVALTSNNTVWTWGYNTSGQIGDGTTMQRNTPYHLSMLNNVVAITAGASHTVVLTSNGVVWAWGQNAGGQIGDGTTMQRNTPVQVSLPATVFVAIAGGGSHTLALDSNGAVWAWGSNSYGQLGDGSTLQKNSPVPIGLSGITAVAAGLNHSVALKSDGTVWTWGWNFYGQLGDGSTLQKTSPVMLPAISLSGVSAVAAGYYSTVALKTDGSVRAWGDNSRGQIGDGTNTQRNIPTSLSVLSGVFSAVSAGAYHGAALKSDGTIWNWGWNAWGQLGDNTTIQHNSPVQVTGFSLFPVCGPMAACNAGTGLCMASPATNGTACNDSNACTQVDTCQGGACTGGSPVVCVASDQCHTLGVCSSASGVCSNPTKADGSSCNDSNACTQTDTCQTGVCTGASPVTCAAPDPCHGAGACNPVNGVCSYPSKADGTACSDSNACTQTDSCQGGVCTGSNAVTCSLPDQCHAAGTCNPATGSCSNPPKPDGAACNDSNPCSQTDSCQAGVCTGSNPVACPAIDQCHLAGTCSSATGLCSSPVKPNGSACNDGNSCTQTDTCQAGICTGTTSVACAAPDQCHTAGTCVPATGVCSYPAKAPGSICDDGNPCTQTDTCQAGACTGASPVVCAPADLCHTAGACNPINGICSYPTKPNGTVCTDYNACTLTDTCQAGVCTGSNPVVCSLPDQCHVAGTCNPVTGVCSNPLKADGAMCDDGNACSQTDTCKTGTCTGANPVVCAALDTCHAAGTCDAVSGKCSNPVKPDNSVCNDGNGCTQTDTCKFGVCLGTNPVACVALDQCHSTGICAPATGICSNPTQVDGYLCNDGNLCTQKSTCIAGLCTAKTPVTCPALDQCHEPGTCDMATGACSAPIKADDSPCDDSNACTHADTCKAGKCAAGTPVDCSAVDECHETGTCDKQSGTCSNPKKSDGSLCSLGTCQGATCTPLPDASATSTGSAPPSATMDLSCHCGIVGGEPSPPAAWLGGIALLALVRRRSERRGAVRQLH